MAGSAQRGPARILVVEDDALVGMALEALLTGLGYVIHGPVRTAEAAVQAARELFPDLILMDVKLADDRDGVEAAEAIRAERACPIVFVTAYGDPDMRRRMNRIAGIAVLGKPVSEPLVRMTLRQLLPP